MTTSLSPALDGTLQFFNNRSGQRVAYYKSRGNQGAVIDSHPLVLLHSINAAASAYEVRPLFEHFAPTRPTFVLEWPGFGQSERAPADRKPDYDFSLYADTLQDFLAHLSKNHPPSDVVAMSLSGEHAALVAKERPELFHSLTLLSPTGLSREPPRADRLSHFLPRLLSGRPWSQPLFSLLSSHASIRYFLGKSFFGTVDEGLLAYCYETSHQPGADSAPWAFLGGRFAVPEVFQRVYLEVQTPTLVLYDKDAYTSFDRLGELLLKNRAFRAMRIPNTRGLPHWDNPKLTCAAITQHLHASRRPTSVPDLVPELQQSQRSHPNLLS